MEPTFITREEANTLVGTKVRDIELYRRAFIHKSALKVYNFETSNETLEFMGDSVLGFIITKFLFDKYEKNQEGFLTRARTKLVCGKTLAAIAEKLGLYKWIVMDEKGMRNEWFKNPKIMEDAFEAFVGAIYLDIGMIHTREFVLRVFNDPTIVDMNAVLRKDDNFKDILMRYCQARKYDLPEYVMDAKDSTRFRIRVFVLRRDMGFGVASTKKEAEQKAACFALKNLRGDDTNNAPPCPRVD
jgi:ribonuclease-3|tara:strand:- start:1112 stop:1840 length:729 start_codon:yes stop_codon:yes gene_type:complete